MPRLVVEANEHGRQSCEPSFTTVPVGLDDFDEAYDVYARAADTGALKVALTRNGDE